MQPTTNPTFSNIYTQQRHHPYPHFQFGSHPGSDPPAGFNPGYYPSYSITHSNAPPYNAHHHAIGGTLSSTYAAELVPQTYAGAITYAIGAAPLSTNIPQNRAADEPVPQYGNAFYTAGATMPQDVVSQRTLSVMPTQSAWTYPVPTVQPRGQWKTIPKKTKIVQSAWCEICKIECNTRDVLDKHKSGKKHIKNIEKLTAAGSVGTASTTRSKPVIGPSENPKKGNVGMKKKAESTTQDLEIKRRKVLEGGAAADAVKVCGICNVVCNSDVVFKFHLAGQKHALMWEKYQQTGAGAV